MSEKVSEKVSEKNNQYWKANIQLMLILLSIWFVVSFGFGILLSDFLDQYRFFGFKLGYWFSHQGSIFVFVILIFVYSWQMNRLDKRFGDS
ncbi:MAG: putative solute:sodium symporter small subunit [Candidatus Azotimanducaceae bacterium]